MEAMIDYVSRRSVALIMTAPEGAYVGSASCIQIGQTFLLATAAHNLDSYPDSSQIRLLPRGVRASPGIPFLARSHPRSESHPRDVAWLKVKPEVAARAGLLFLGLGDLTPGAKHSTDHPYFVQGFPAAELLVHSDRDLDPLSLGLGTMSVSGNPSDELVVEYPPSSPVDSGLELVPPDGISGGGIWTFPRFSDHLIWTPSEMRLAAINRSWLQSKGLLFAELIDNWLRLVWHDFAALRGEIESFPYEARQ